MEKKIDQIKPHDYDGIQEYDNQLPRWWVMVFVISVLFSLGYWLYYYTYGWGPDQVAHYEKKKQEHQVVYASKQTTLESFDQTTVQNMIQNAAIMDEAKSIFVQNCAACHGAQGQGIIGPNLTDEYWLHGFTPVSLYQVIEDGVPQKGMVAWKGTLNSSQIQQIVAYIVSLQGSKPPSPKAPQGEQIH